MPVYKYIANRILTALQNIFLGVKLSEYHTGFRAFSRKLLETLPLAENSDDFVFDNQMIAQAVFFGFPIGEISCPTLYFQEASRSTFAAASSTGCACSARRHSSSHIAGASSARPGLNRPAERSPIGKTQTGGRPLKSWQRASGAREDSPTAPAASVRTEPLPRLVSAGRGQPTRSGRCFPMALIASAISLCM